MHAGEARTPQLQPGHWDQRQQPGTPTVNRPPSTASTAARSIPSSHASAALAKSTSSQPHGAAPHQSHTQSMSQAIAPYNAQAPIAPHQSMTALAGHGGTDVAGGGGGGGSQWLGAPHPAAPHGGTHFLPMQELLDMPFDQLWSRTHVQPPALPNISFPPASLQLAAPPHAARSSHGRLPAALADPAGQGTEQAQAIASGGRVGRYLTGEDDLNYTTANHDFGHQAHGAHRSAATPGASSRGDPGMATPLSSLSRGKERSHGQRTVSTAGTAGTAGSVGGEAQVLQLEGATDPLASRGYAGGAGGRPRLNSAPMAA